MILMSAHMQDSNDHWHGECPICAGKLMRVNRRALAGGDPVLASLSLGGFALALIFVFAGGHWGWPPALLMVLISLILGLQRRTRWQCRRCRASFRHLAGSDLAGS